MVLEILTRAARLLPLLFCAAAADLPPGSRIDPTAERFPEQRLRSEIAGGRQSYLVALGNTAFSSPLLFGEPARSAGLSCNSCHVNGHNNREFHIPGHSARPGGLDPAGPLFNRAADDGVFAHVDIPSLRGIRFLAPYGRDGRIASLREFARHVIVVEFAGPEPTPEILDALVAYMNEFEFLPNPRLAGDGALTGPKSPDEAAGEPVFAARCAGCHVPGTAFSDGRAHDVGSDGRFRTPTLLNIAESAPYGHDGRWADLAAAVEGHAPLPAPDRDALLAYLEAIGGVEEPSGPATFRGEMAELATYVGLLDETLRRQDVPTTRFVVGTVQAELRRVRRAFPDGDAARLAARPDRRKRLPLDYAALEAGLEAVALRAEAGEAASAQVALDAYHDLAERMVANYPRPGR